MVLATAQRTAHVPTPLVAAARQKDNTAMTAAYQTQLEVHASLHKATQATKIPSRDLSILPNPEPISCKDKDIGQLG